jgi:cyanophycinase
MTTIALQGGRPFAAHDQLDSQLLRNVARDGTASVVVLPTADAFEHPERLVAAAQTWAQRLTSADLTINVTGLMVLRRVEALDTQAAATIRGARAVWLVGDQPLHMRAVLKDTPCWDALRDVLGGGGLVVGCGGAADGLCDPMVDPRGGAFTLGLGLVSGLALVTASETWSVDRLHRTQAMVSAIPLVRLPTNAALVRTVDGAGQAVWAQHGDVVVSGQLPV